MLPKKRTGIHPGRILQEEILEPLGITQSALARHIGVMPFVICEIVNGRRNISPRMAVLLSRALDTTPEFWMALQTAHDLAAFMATREGKRAHGIRPIQHAATSEDRRSPTPSKAVGGKA